MLLAALPLLFAATAEFKVDTTRSKVIVAVYKKGGASGFLHDHQMVPSEWSGTVRVDPAHPETIAVDLIFQSGSLHDQETALSAGDRAKVDAEAKSSVLEAEKFKEIEFKADRFTPSAPGSLKGTLDGTLTLHGQTHPISVPVEASLEGGEIHAKGKTPLKQTAFGIKPVYKMLGAIQVKDSVDIEFDVVIAPVAAAPAATTTGAAPAASPH
jgi:polyisoprenoid-binding protein YceI